METNYQIDEKTDIFHSSPTFPDLSGASSMTSFLSVCPPSIDTVAPLDIKKQGSLFALDLDIVSLFFSVVIFFLSRRKFLKPLEQEYPLEVREILYVVTRNFISIGFDQVVAG